MTTRNLHLLPPTLDIYAVRDRVVEAVLNREDGDRDRLAAYMRDGDVDLDLRDPTAVTVLMGPNHEHVLTIPREDVTRPCTN